MYMKIIRRRNCIFANKAENFKLLRLIVMLVLIQSQVTGNVVSMISKCVSIVDHILSPKNAMSSMVFDPNVSRVVSHCSLNCAMLRNC